MRAATKIPALFFKIFLISIHAAHAGSDLKHIGLLITKLQFQSTLPMRAATVYTTIISYRRVFQSTLPMRAATIGRIQVRSYTDISIHAAHAGSDHKCLFCGYTWHNFNPRCPCGQRRRLPKIMVGAKEFQSTLPMRAATRTIRHCASNAMIYFNPRCPCGQRLTLIAATCAAKLYFNPRCPCGQRL